MKRTRVRFPPPPPISKEKLSSCRRSCSAPKTRIRAPEPVRIQGFAREAAGGGTERRLVFWRSDDEVQCLRVDGVRAALDAREVDLYAGVQEVVLPKLNERDVAEIAPNLRRGMDFCFVDTMDELLERALVKAEATD